jgi:hypothetical protein
MIYNFERSPPNFAFRRSVPHFYDSFYAHALKLQSWLTGCGAPWARATKNVKKPLGKKGRTFEIKKHGPKAAFLVF